MAETPEVLSYRLAEMDKKLDQILAQVKATNGRVDKAEDDIIRIQERTGPWTAGGILSGVSVIVYAVWDKFVK